MGKERDPDLLQIYSKSKRRYDSVKSSVEHTLRIIEDEKKEREKDSVEIPMKSHQHRKLRMLDEMIYDVNSALIMADEGGNKSHRKVLLNKLKKLTIDRDNYVKKLEHLQDLEEEEKKKKKKKKEEDPDPKEAEEEDPTEEEGEDPDEKKKKKKEDGNPYDNSGVGKDPKEGEEEDPEEEKKKKKKKKEEEDK